MAIFLLEPETKHSGLPQASAKTSPGCAASIFRSWPDTPEGSGVAGRPSATRSKHQQRFSQRHAFAGLARGCGGRVRAAAALPLTCNGRSVGVLLVTRREQDRRAPIVSLLERMSANISFALDNFDHEAARKHGEQAMRRLNRMFAAISATNEAALRAKTPQELYQRVCDAAVYSGKSFATVVLFSEPGLTWLKPVAAAAKLSNRSKPARASRSIPAISMATALPAGIPDPASVRQRRLLASGGQWQESRTGSRRQGQRRRTPDQGRPKRRRRVSWSAKPGRRMRKSSRCWRGSPKTCHLRSIISSAQAKRRRPTSRKSELTRMFAALSATNEAIMRASRAPSCSNWSARPRRMAEGSIRRLSRWPDPTANSSYRCRGRANRGQHATPEVSINEALPEGRGLCGTAFRTRRPASAMIFWTISEPGAFRPGHSERGRKSARLSAAGRWTADGVMIFISSEKDTFTPEFAELLQRLADNVSFALGSFDRADEKARTEEQKERLTRMFAALSATNEAIMRAKTQDGAVRAGLRSCDCRRQVHLDHHRRWIEPGGDFLETVASDGPIGDAPARSRCRSILRVPKGGASPGPRSGPGSLHQQRLSGRFRQRRAFLQGGSRQRDPIGRGFPLLRTASPSAPLLFLSSELGAFSPELVELLQRLAENVSFALDNFDRADEKARTEEQKERLTRMLAALSATNEAIVRASRAANCSIWCARRRRRRQVHRDHPSG